MINTTTQPQAAPVAAVTAQYDFCPATPEGEKLFSVRAGIPLSSAFDQLSRLVGSSIASVEALAMMGDEDPDLIAGALWQSVQLMNFAHALVQSMHKGHTAWMVGPLFEQTQSVGGAA